MPALALSQVAVHLRPEDNIVVAARHLLPGTEFDFQGERITLPKRVGMGHKVAVRPIAKGQAVSKYGQIIGFPKEDIKPGAHAHVHNVPAAAFERDYAFCRDCPSPPAAPAEVRHFMGY